MEINTNRIKVNSVPSATGRERSVVVITMSADMKCNTVDDHLRIVGTAQITVLLHLNDNYGL